MIPALTRKTLTMSLRPLSALLAAICGSCSAAALAFEPPEDTPAAAPASAKPPPEEISLGGPKVKPAEAERTLVHREMNGALVRLEERPETAALKLLKLSKAQRDAADELLVKRGALVSKTLSANMELFLELQGARQAGDRDAAQKLMIRMRDAAKDLLDPPLVDTLAGAVGEERGKELRALVDEYFGALAVEENKPADGADRPGAAPSRPRAAAAAALNPRMRMRMELNLAVREMARTLAASVTERQERMDALLKAAEATPEQEARIRAIMRAGNAGGQPPSQEAREETTRKILAELSPEQREKYLKAARSR